MRAGRWSEVQIHGKKQASATLYRDMDVWDHGGFTQIRQTSDLVRTTLLDRNGKLCLHTLLMWCWWYLDVFLLSTEWLWEKQTWRSISPSFHAGRDCENPAFSVTQTRGVEIQTHTRDTSLFCLAAWVHFHYKWSFHTHIKKHLETDLRANKPNTLSDNYAQVVAIKQVNVNLTEAFI